MLQTAQLIAFSLLVKLAGQLYRKFTLVPMKTILSVTYKYHLAIQCTKSVQN